jgi:hypothetical protein
MIGLVSVLLVLLSGGYASAQPAGLAAAGVPAEIADLCRILKDQIVNRGVDVGIDRDFLGMPRPSGGGVDIGAIECDSGSDEEVSALPPPTNFRSDPAAPAACVTIRWDYTATPDLLAFRLYLRAEGGSYTAGTPATQITATPTMPLSLACVQVTAPHRGPWYAVLTAQGRAQKESARSNEIQLVLGHLPPPPIDIIPTPPPKPIVPPPVVVLPPPLLRPTPPVALLPPLPSVPGSGRLTDTDTWQGRGAMPSPLTAPAPGRLSETCVWQGRGCP